MDVDIGFCMGKKKNEDVAIDGVTYRKCTKCPDNCGLKVLDESNFRVRSYNLKSGKKTRFGTTCKKCESEYSKKYNKENPEKLERIIEKLELKIQDMIKSARINV
jgi:hypothetical protein